MDFGNCSGISLHGRVRVRVENDHVWIDSQRRGCQQNRFLGMNIVVTCTHGTNEDSMQRGELNSQDEFLKISNRRCASQTCFQMSNYSDANISVGRFLHFRTVAVRYVFPP